MRRKGVWIVLACVLGLAVPAGQAAVTFSQVASNEDPTTVIAFNIPITVTAGTNSVMFVGLCTAPGSGTGNQITAISFNGAPLTLVATGITTGASITRGYVYRLDNPAAVASTVSMSLSTNVRMAGGVVVLHGVNPTTPIDLPPPLFFNNTDTQGASVDVVTETTDMILDVACKKNGTHNLAMVAQTNRTQRFNIETTNATISNNVIAAGSTRTGSGSLTMNWVPTDTHLVGYGVIGMNVNSVPTPTGGLSLGFKLLK